MSNCALDIGGVYETVGNVNASSRGTTLASTYTEVVAATTFDYEGFWVNLHKGATSDTLVDIAIGGSGSEQLIVEDLYFCGVTSDGYQNAGCIFIPIRIPQGSRIAARSTQAITLDITGGTGSPGFMEGMAGCDTYGSDGTNGTQVNGGSSANTEPASWSQVTASTTNPIKALMVMLGRNGNTSLTDGDYLLDIGIGAAASEVAILENLPFTADSVRDILQPRVFGPFPVSIPAGTRLAARLQTTVTDATDRNMDLVLYGFY